MGKRKDERGEKSLGRKGFASCAPRNRGRINPFYKGRDKKAYFKRGKLPREGDREVKKKIGKRWGEMLSKNKGKF